MPSGRLVCTSTGTEISVAVISMRSGAEFLSECDVQGIQIPLAGGGRRLPRRTRFRRPSWFHVGPQWDLLGLDDSALGRSSEERAASAAPHGWTNWCPYMEALADDVPLCVAPMRGNLRPTELKVIFAHTQQVRVSSGVYASLRPQGTSPVIRLTTVDAGTEERPMTAWSLSCPARESEHKSCFFLALRDLAVRRRRDSSSCGKGESVFRGRGREPWGVIAFQTLTRVCEPCVLPSPWDQGFASEGFNY